MTALRLAETADRQTWNCRGEMEEWEIDTLTALIGWGERYLGYPRGAVVVGCLAQFEASAVEGGDLDTGETTLSNPSMAEVFWSGVVGPWEAVWAGDLALGMGVGPRDLVWSDVVDFWGFGRVGDLGVEMVPKDLVWKVDQNFRKVDGGARHQKW